VDLEQCLPKKSLTSTSGATSTSDWSGPDVSGTHSHGDDAKLSDEEGRPSVFELSIGTQYRQ